ncbi:MAG TPA: S-layer protein, partial [Thermococcus sp.]|nr:S-layer protein [Thermococcus sp.]
PVYNNYYENTNTTPSAEEWDELGDYWWNGAAYSGDYEDWKAASGVTFEIEDRDFLGDEQLIDWDITINTIEFHADDEEWDADYPPEDSDVVLYIPAGNFSVTLNYQLWNTTYTYSETDDVWGTTTEDTIYVIDDDSPATYDDYTKSGTPEVYAYGIGEGDTFTVFGNEFYVLDVNASAETVTYGHDWGKEYLDSGASKAFGEYTVKVLDIDVNRDKALLEVTGPEGSETITIKTPDEGGKTVDVFDDGGILITLHDTFIGIEGTETVLLEVQTDVETVESGDELLEGWEAQFSFGTDGKGNDVVTAITLTNTEDLEGSTITLINDDNAVYKLDYVVNVKKKDVDDDDDDELAVDAEIVFLPEERVYDEDTITVGDDFEGWTVDDIEVTIEPTEAAIVSKITTPITVLDTELMEAGLDSVDSNLILVGGPVVNSVTAALAETLGVPADYEGWASEYGTGADSGVVKYVAEVEDINGYGVVLVAGSDREGTAAAAEALMKYLAGLN